MARRTLAKSDVKGFNDAIAPFGLALAKKDRIELVEDDRGARYIVNGVEAFLLLDGRVVPLLSFLRSRPLTVPVVTVDMGAVKFVVNGADIMRPGVTGVADGVIADGLVQIVDQQHGKTLAIGIALFDAAVILAAASGKVVKNLHWVGDGR